MRWDQFQSINTFFNKDKIEDHYSKVINNFNKIYSEKFEILSSDRRAQILEIEEVIAILLTNVCSKVKRVVRL